MHALAGLLLVPALVLSMALLPAVSVAEEVSLPDAEAGAGASDLPPQEDPVCIQAMFFVAYPEDPSKLPETEADLGDVRYSDAIHIEGAIDPAVDWLENPSEGTKAFGFDGKDVAAHLVCVPTNDQLVAAVADSGGSFDPETQTVVWYVIKSLSDGWHVDGILVDKVAVEPEPDPEEPTPPTDPVDPSDPAEPTDPVEPMDPVDPAGPVEPVAPEEPQGPGDSGAEPLHPQSSASEPSDVSLSPSQPIASSVRRNVPDAGAPSDEVPVVEDASPVAQETVAVADSVPLGSISDLEFIPGSFFVPPSSSSGLLTEEAATAMQVAAVCGVVVLGGGAVCLGGASALSFVRMRRSAKALELLLGRVR